ncbi:hypothetical protein ACQP3F_30950, partial [Escherichia coli]
MFGIKVPSQNVPTIVGPCILLIRAFFKKKCDKTELVPHNINPQKCPQPKNDPKNPKTKLKGVPQINPEF